MRREGAFLFVAFLLAGLISVFSANAVSAEIEDVPWRSYIPKVDGTAKPDRNVRIESHPDGIRMWLASST